MVLFPRFKESSLPLESFSPGLFFLCVFSPGSPVKDSAGQGRTFQCIRNRYTSQGCVHIRVQTRNSSQSFSKKLFRQVSIPLTWISGVDQRMSEEGLSDAMVQPLAREWIEANRETVDRWLDSARAAVN